MPIVRMVTFERLEWDGIVNRMGSTRNTCIILARKTLSKNPLGKARNWDDNIQADHRKL
jgi:hypothetical protein